MSSRALEFLEGDIRYPEDLPCPEIDTDLKPRERRYISDIAQVKKYRRFQRTYQATRQNISFVFTAEQAARFQDWYAFSIIEGGAWFYADWPILHKEKDIAYRFVTRPVWTFLARGNFHVSATVELDEGRKVGRYVNIFTSKLYPYYFSDNVTTSQMRAKGMPFASIEDGVTKSQIAILSASEVRYTYGNYSFGDDITITPITIISASEVRYVYTKSEFDSDVTLSPISIGEGAIVARLLTYDRVEDDVTVSPIAIVSGDLQ